MVTLQKSGDSAVKFVFTDSDHYLYGSGQLETPVNSLLLVLDESEMVTFKKLSGDPFLSFRADNSNLGTKAAIEQFYKDNMVGSSGGGSESGITSGDVETMIDTALDDYYDKDEVDAGFDSVNATLSGKADTAVVNQAISEATQAILAVSGDVQTKVNTTDFNAYSAATDSRLAEDEEVTAAALINLDETKQDALVYYSEDTENKSAEILITNDDGEGSTGDNHINIGGGVAEIGIYNEYDDGQGNVTSNNSFIYADQTMVNLQAGVTENGDTTSTELTVESTGVTINGDAVATEPYVDAALSGKADTSAVTAAIDAAKAYYISFATLATQGITDNDWDGIVAAIDAHRPIYAGYPRQDGGIIYYGVECMNKNSGNTEIVMTASDNSAHYFYTFTKNGSNDYSYTVSTKPYVPDITTAITSGSTDSEIPTAKAVYDAIPTGGGATYSAGTNISIDTANTINCTLPISAGTGTNSIIANTQNQATKKGSVAIGWATKATNTYAFAQGAGSEATQYACFAEGEYSKAEGYVSHAEGYRTNAKGGYAHSEGYYTKALNNYEHASGTYNNSVNDSTASGQTLFSVGNGTADNARHNAFEIRQNGDIYVNDGTNDVRLQDTILALGGLKLVSLTQSEYDNLATKSNDTLYIINNVVS